MSTELSIQSRAHFTALPEEKIIDIFTELPSHEIMSTGRVCKLFYQISWDEILWAVKAVEEGIDITAKSEEEKKIHPGRRLEKKLKKRALQYYACSEMVIHRFPTKKIKQYADFLLRVEEMKKTPFIGSRNILPVSERMLSAIFAYAEYTVGNQGKTKQRFSREDIASQTALVLGDHHIFEKVVQRGGTPLSADKAILKGALACAFAKNDVDLLKTIESQYFNGKLELLSLSGALLYNLRKNQTEMVDFLLRYTLSPKDSAKIIYEVFGNELPNRKQFLDKVSLDGIDFSKLLDFLHVADKNEDSAFIKRVLEASPSSSCKTFTKKLFLSALETGHVEMAGVLCKKYKKLIKRNFKRLNPQNNIFKSAAKSGSVEMFKFVLEFAASHKLPYSLKKITKLTKTWHNAALKSGNENLVTFLADRYGFTTDDKSLLAAIEGKNIKLVQDVLNIQLFMQDLSSNNVLMPVVPALSELVSEGEIEFLTKLAELGIQPTLLVPSDSIELLEAAFQSGELEVIKFVIETWKLSVPQNIFSIASRHLPHKKMLKNGSEQTDKIYAYLLSLPKGSFDRKSIHVGSYEHAVNFAKYAYSKTRKKNENEEPSESKADSSSASPRSSSASPSSRSAGPSDDEGASASGGEKTRGKKNHSSNSNSAGPSNDEGASASGGEKTRGKKNHSSNSNSAGPSNDEGASASGGEKTRGKKNHSSNSNSAGPSDDEGTSAGAVDGLHFTAQFKKELKAEFTKWTNALEQLKGGNVRVELIKEDSSSESENDDTKSD